MSVKSWYIPGFEYSTMGLLKIVRAIEREARIDFLLNGLTQEHRELLQSACMHQGRTIDLNPQGWTCWHEIYCLECGKLLEKIDSSG